MTDEPNRAAQRHQRPGRPPRLGQEHFAQEHFGAADLGDQRRTRRLVKLAGQLLENPSGTLPARISNPSDLTALYRLLEAPEVTHQRLLAPATACTRERMRQAPVVLVLHDDTTLDYTSKKSLEHLGQIGNGPGRGYLCHNSLAITPQREVLGLAHQILHTRRQAPAGETKRQRREHPKRESRLWLEACQALGPAPAGGRWIDIADRGADTFEFLAYELREHRDFILRAAQDRKLWGEDHLGADRIHRYLKGYCQDLPVLGARSVSVAAVAPRHGRPGHGPREALVQVAAGPVRLAGSRFPRGQASEKSLDLWVIWVREFQAPAGVEALEGVEPLEWILLTSLPSGTWEAACRHVDYYACRPLIEEYHKSQKTGCRVEALQFTHQSRLEPAIGLLSVVAATLLGLRQLARDPEAQATPATQVVPALHVAVLAAWRYGPDWRMDPRRAGPPGTLSVGEFALALARLGGHQGRKHDGFPGWLTLWRGWEKLTLMVRGVQALRGYSV